MTLAPDAAAGLRVTLLRGLELTASLGVHPHEHAAPQRVVVDLELAVADDAAPSGIGPDRLDRVVDYEALANRVRLLVGSGHTLLVETLAERIALDALAADPRVRLARVRVEKPDALPGVAAVGTVVERRRA